MGMRQVEQQSGDEATTLSEADGEGGIDAGGGAAASARESWD
jgi:hypothetical protein